MGVTKALVSIAGITAGAAILCNLPVSWFMASQAGTLAHLQKGTLQTLEPNPKNFTEALGLSSLLPELDTHGVKLHAVVHQTLGVDEFRPYFKGDIYLDTEKAFYGPKERWASVFSLLRVSVLKNSYRVFKKGVKGNFEGEGRLLGGVFVIGPGEQGILYEHQEKVFGDHADLKEILKAVKEIKKPES